MAQDIGVIIKGDREVSLKFDTFPDRLHDRLLSTITNWERRLLGQVKAATPVATGKLQSEIDGAVFDDTTRITGAVFVSGTGKNDYAKAGAEEYGAHARISVRSHTQRLDHVFARKLQSPTEVAVERYTRQANIVAHRFLRGPITGDAGSIEADLRADVAQLTEA